MEKEFETFTSKLSFVLICLLVSYVAAFQYFDGNLKAIPNLHTYILLPVFLYSIFVLFVSFKNGLEVSLTVFTWTPFLLLTAFEFLFVSTQDRFMMWFICAILLSISIKVELDKQLPISLVVIWGAWFMGGIVLQIVNQDFFNRVIVPLFQQECLIISFSVDYGYSGFSYQVAFTAVFITFVEAIALSQCRRNKFDKRKYYIWLVFAILCLWFIALTGKRSSFLICLAIPFILILLEQRSKKAFLAVGVFFLAISCLFLLVLTVCPEILNMFSFSARILETCKNLTLGVDFTSGRISIWKRAWDLFKTSPIWGTGINTFMYISGLNILAHSAYLQILSEQGLVGEILFVVPLVYCLFVCIKNYRRIEEPQLKAAMTFSLFCQLEFFLNSFVENTTTVYYVELFFYFISIGIMNSVLSQCGLQRGFLFRIPLYDRICDKLLEKFSKRKQISE